MKGLLDYIFLKIEIERLNPQQTKEYLVYLQEILPQITSEAELSKFISIKVSLDERLTEVDAPPK
jgi:hypothetical protein